MLARAPSEEKHMRQDLPDDWPASPESPYIKPVMRALMFVLCDYRVYGKENLPEAPYIVVSNHLSFFDIPAVNLPTPFGTVGLAARKYQDTWMRWLFELFPIIWVTQFSADRTALRDAITVLKHGVPLGVAPEGTRSQTGGLIEGRSGVAFIANRTNVPIVPCGVQGTEKILKHPRPLVVARFGKPFRLPEGRAKGDQLDAYTERIMCAIAALLPETYHGVYAGNPLIDEMRAIVT
jgi:1-acyl-sn-glycerol-3-phosphate acyltransferase